MRYIATIALALALVLTTRAAVADQNDPRLEPLFATLAGIDNPIQAFRLENAIWSLWIASDDPEVAHLMEEGVSAMQTYRLEAAVDLFTAIIERAPDYAEGWNKRATVYYMLGNYEGSLADIDETLAREPRHFGALSGRGLIYDALGDQAKALEAFEEALEIHPFLFGARARVEELKRSLQPI